jgi:hypothetical protein
MNIEKQNNGQVCVSYGNMKIVHTSVSGLKFNECTIFDGGVYKIVQSNDQRFKPLFIALVNFLNQQ